MPDTDPIAHLRGSDGEIDPALVAKEMKDWHRWMGRMDVLLADDLPPQIAGSIRRYTNHEAGARFAILQAENERLRTELAKAGLREDIMRDALISIENYPIRFGGPAMERIHEIASEALDAVERRTEPAAAEVAA